MEIAKVATKALMLLWGTIRNPWVERGGMKDKKDISSGLY